MRFICGLKVRLFFAEHSPAARLARSNHHRCFLSIYFLLLFGVRLGHLSLSHMRRKEPKPQKIKPPTAAELQAQVQELQSRLREEEATRLEWRQKAEAAQVQLMDARAAQLRAEDAAQAAEKAEHEALQKAAAERAEFKRRLSLATSEALASTALDSSAPPGNSASSDAMAAEIEALKGALSAQKEQAAAELASMAKLSQEKLEALEATMASSEHAAFSRGKKLAEESAYRKGYHDGKREKPAAALASLAVGTPSLASPAAAPAARATGEGNVTARATGTGEPPLPPPPGGAAASEAASTSAAQEEQEARLEQEAANAMERAMLQEQLAAAQERSGQLAAELADLRKVWDVAEGYTRELLVECQTLRDAEAKRRAGEVAAAGAGNATATASVNATTGVALSSSAESDSGEVGEIVTAVASAPARPLSVPERIAVESQTYAALVLQKAQRGHCARSPLSASSSSVTSSSPAERQLSPEQRIGTGPGTDPTAPREYESPGTGGDGPHLPQGAKTSERLSGRASSEREQVHELAATGGFRMKLPLELAVPPTATALGPGGFPALHMSACRAPPVPPLQAHKPASYHTSPRWSRALSPRSARNAMGATWTSLVGGQDASGGGGGYMQPGAAPQAPPIAPRQAHKPASFSTSARWTRALTPRSARGVMHFNRPMLANDEVAV